MANTIETKPIVDAKEAASILNCSRTVIERLQLKGKLTPVPTVHPKFYYSTEEVLRLKGEKSQNLTPNA